MLLFSNLIPRRHPGGFPKFYFDMKFWTFSKFSKKIQRFQTKIELREASWVSDLEKGTSQLSLEKKIIPLSCLEKILGFVTYLPSKRGTAPIFRCAILSFFQHFLKESQNFKLKYSFGKPPGGLLGFRFEKSNITAFTGKKNYPIIFFLNKIKICKHKHSETDCFCWKNDRYGISENRCRTSLWWKIHCKNFIFFKLRYTDTRIIFFPVKAVILLFPNLKPRRPPGGFPKLYFSLKFWLSFKKCWLWWEIHYKT